MSRSQANQKDKDLYLSYINEMKKPSTSNQKNFFGIEPGKKDSYESTFPYTNPNQLANPDQFMNPNQFMNLNQSTKSTERFRNMNANNKRSS